MEPDLSYTEYPLRILDQKERGTRRKVVKIYKIQWSHHTEEEATWETEDYLNRHYPGFLSFTSGILFSLPKFNHPISGRDSFLRGVGCDTSGVSALRYNHCTILKLKRKVGEINSRRRGSNKSQSKQKKLKEKGKKSEKLLKFQFKKVHKILVGS